VSVSIQFNFSLMMMLVMQSNRPCNGPLTNIKNNFLLTAFDLLLNILAHCKKRDFFGA